MSVDGVSGRQTEGWPAQPGVSSQGCSDAGRRAIRAVILDLDGTIYLQRPVRLRMLRRLLSYCAVHPAAGYRTIRTVIAYRRAQELLREPSLGPPAYQDVAEAQILAACGMTRVEPGAVRNCVARWIEREPLDLLKRYLRPGVREFLIKAKERGLRLAVVSDYPARDKLQSMGLAEYFDVVVTASDADVQRLKPHPKGIQAALARLGVEPEEAVYFGDREEVDSAAAGRAGVTCVILKRRQEISALLLPRCTHSDRNLSAEIARARGANRL